MPTATATKSTTGTTKTVGRRGNPNFGKRGRTTTTAAVKATKQQRVRRGPVELLQAKQEKLARAEERVEKLKEEIQALEERHSSRLEVERLLKDHSPEELTAMIENLRKQQSVVKKAAKRASSNT